MLELRGLTRRFGDATAVDNLSLAVADGEMVAVLGRSGAGKSTLLNMINRLIDPSGGEILYGGRDIARLRGAELLAWRRQSAMIFQRFNLVGRLSVLTNVLTGRLNHPPRLPKLVGLFTDRERDIAIDALAALGMEDHALKRADQLSGGQQQRVAIARALVQEPRIMLADEPVASLDPVNAQAVMEALRRINRELGITVLCNLHSVPLAQAWCDRAIALSAGRLVYDGPVAGLDEPTLLGIYGSAAALSEAH
ncbi:phosphonate ABC transporter ATP-binding protein [Falsiroseomonas selenitidurans]|uniref:Phosphonate ABC transporter ATP-binding protein n=1 Tax=Falsiroseomonas selenitidurans TaxID=2716335 RepID=A0ABX1DY05_9PROT|nr:phosphonate ABC transporter ATP-binding protein [Falsiroseomonas selenitidurans]NKC29686.1 phosphonate ABC transporter ATP-binding protein [Falsiroseomonas selenitidurans]